MSTWVVVLIVVAVVVVVSLAVAGASRARRRRAVSTSIGLPPIGALSGEDHSQASVRRARGHEEATGQDVPSAIVSHR